MRLPGGDALSKPPPFEPIQHGDGRGPVASDVYLAKVIGVNDPDSLNRVQVRILSADGLGEQDGPLWARVAVPFAGSDYGAFFIPDVDDEVLIAFISGDPRFPVVIGSLWNGAAQAPETIGSSVDRWTIVGKQGTRIAIVEESPSTAQISFTTPTGVSGVLTDEGGGKVEFTAGGNTVTMEPAGVTVDSPAVVTVNASQVKVSAGLVQVDSGMSTFSGVVQCQTLIATTVVGTTYTPGAGNIW